MAPGRAGQTIGWAGGSRKDTTRGLLVVCPRGVLPLAAACCRAPAPGRPQPVGPVSHGPLTTRAHLPARAGRRAGGVAGRPCPPACSPGSPAARQACLATATATTIPNALQEENQAHPASCHQDASGISQGGCRGDALVRSSVLVPSLEAGAGRPQHTSAPGVGVARRPVKADGGREARSGHGDCRPSMKLTNVQLWLQFPKPAMERGEVVRQAQRVGVVVVQHPPPAAGQALGRGSVAGSGQGAMSRTTLR